MKKLILLLILLTLLLKCSVSYSDSFGITISVTEGEKSKDSWSSESSISINGGNMSYSLSRSGPRYKNIVKSCTLTNEQIEKIKSVIKDGNLLVSDSLFDESTKYKSYEHFVNVAADIVMEEKTSRIRINGDVSDLENKELYKNSYKLINLLVKYADKCN